MAPVLVRHRLEAAALENGPRHRTNAEIGERHAATPAH
jgi:hypothetical protein